MNDINVSLEDIKNTKKYKSLDFIQKKMILKRKSVGLIRNSVNIISNIGFVNWRFKNMTNERQTEIVIEIIRAKKIKL